MRHAFFTGPPPDALYPYQSSSLAPGRAGDSGLAPPHLFTGCIGKIPSAVMSFLAPSAHLANPLIAMAPDAITLYVLAVVFVATLIRSAIGFGEALFAVPLLALRLPLEVAAPLAVLVSITIALIVVVQDWRKVHARSMGWLMFATIFGIPLGLALLTSSHQQAVKAVLALLIMAFSIYSLVGQRPPQLASDSLPWLLGCGFTAGVLGGAYGMNGPPLAIYGAMRRWSAQQFRATLQGYFLPASILGMVGYWLKGLWGPAVTRYFLWALLPMIPAIFCGKFVNHRLQGHSFLKYVYSALVAIGAILLVQALRG
jgi:uncharacterized protein